MQNEPMSAKATNHYHYCRDKSLGMAAAAALAAAPKCRPQNLHLQKKEKFYYTAGENGGCGNHVVCRLPSGRVHLENFNLEKIVSRSETKWARHLSPQNVDRGWHLTMMTEIGNATWSPVIDGGSICRQCATGPYSHRQSTQPSNFVCAGTCGRSVCTRCTAFLAELQFTYLNIINELETNRDRICGSVWNVYLLPNGHQSKG
ncbi:hypothetical protein V9T40_003073 [Parthenolecanium corni]|uniref:Uncharacterized protein n=1 Tax=Parthenolecanium corni TaxID=536013 RepID=A0AAN9U0P5_9HEMI